MEVPVAMLVTLGRTLPEGEPHKQESRRRGASSYSERQHLARSEPVPPLAFGEWARKWAFCRRGSRSTVLQQTRPRGLWASPSGQPCGLLSGEPSQASAFLTHAGDVVCKARSPGCPLRGPESSTLRASSVLWRVLGGTSFALGGSCARGRVSELFQARASCWTGSALFPLPWPCPAGAADLLLEGEEGTAVVTRPGLNKASIHPGVW